MFDYDEYYRKLAPIYDTVRLDRKRDFDNTISVLRNFCDVHSKKLLDIGCGTGRYIEALNRCGANAIGIDRSPHQIEQAKKIIQAVVGNATNLPFSNASFDICCMIMMIHQLGEEERHKAIMEAHRVLVPGGFLFIKTCSKDDLKKRTMNRFFPQALVNDLTRYPDIKLLVEELSVYKKVETKHTSVFVEQSKEETLSAYKAKRTSNIALLAEEDFQKGIQALENHYSDYKTIVKEYSHTFIIAVK